MRHGDPLSEVYVNALIDRAEAAEARVAELEAGIRKVADEWGHADDCEAVTTVASPCDCWNADLRALVCRHDWNLFGKTGSGGDHYELYECRRCGLTKRERGER
jgi:hypothetical protein